MRLEDEELKIVCESCAPFELSDHSRRHSVTEITIFKGHDWVCDFCNLSLKNWAGQNTQKRIYVVSTNDFNYFKRIKSLSTILNESQ